MFRMIAPVGIIVCCISSYLLIADVEPNLEEEIRKSEERVKAQIEESRKAIDIELQKEERSEEEPLRVILAAYQRTILSAQISTPVLTSQVSAAVTAIYKRMGESFKKGDVLITLDETVYDANLLNAQAILDRARVVLRAREELYRDKIASLVDLKDAQAAVANGIAQLALAQNQVDSSIVKAPYDGKVVSLNVEVYELPQPGQPLIEIIQTDPLLAKILVPAKYLNDLEIGKILVVHLEMGASVDAKIIRIGSVIDPASSTIAVDAEVENHEGRLMPGMIGTTRIR